MTNTPSLQHASGSSDRNGTKRYLVCQSRSRASRLPAYLCLYLALSSAIAFAQNAPVARRLPGNRTAGLPGAGGIAAQPSAGDASSSEQYDGPTYKREDFEGTNTPALKFDNAPADILLQTYAEVTGKTLLQSPNLPKVNITLKSEQSELNRDEFLRAIETILVMNNIAIVPDGEKFLRVFPANELRTDGVKTLFDEPAGGAHVEDGKMVSQMITLKNISLEEAKKAIEGFKRKEGMLQTFERTNSILMTDTVENVNRMMEILKFIDQPLVNRDEVNVRPLKFAKAADIKKRLEEIVNESQKEQQQNKQTSAPEAKQSGGPGIVRRNVPGVVRPGAQPEIKANETIETLIDEAERGMIKGKVQIIADERTNLLIIITRPENMKFFDSIIDVLDVEVQTSPDVIVEVVRLEYATAKDVAQMLNDLISNNDSKKDTENEAKSTVADKNDNSGSRTLSEAANMTRRQANVAKEDVESKGRLGELRKEDVKILADERSNAIVVMATKADVQTILGIIKSMDIQLSQVVIETVIVSVTFKDSQETGMDWVQHAMLTTTGKGNTPRFAFANAGGGGSLTPQNVPSGSFASGGGVTGWFTLFDLNMDLILKAIQTDNRSRLMSSPRITTMDNKEASLESTTRIYWSEGSTHYTSSDYYSDNIKNEDIGIKLKVTPRINKRGYITLTIEQEIQSSDGMQTITTRDSKTEFPNLTTRKMGADVAVQSGETVVLGGLADNSISRSVTKVPILGSIPLLGYLFRSDKEETSRTEIIVFLTPRVLDTPAQMEDDARNAKASMGTDGIWDSSWSASRLADPLSPKNANKVLENGKDTVTKARYPQTSYLTGLNKGDNVTTNAAIRETLENTPKGQVPYIHFTDAENGETQSPATEKVTDGAEAKTSARRVIENDEPFQDTDITSRITPGSFKVEESTQVITNAPAND